MPVLKLSVQVMHVAHGLLPLHLLLQAVRPGITGLAAVHLAHIELMFSHKTCVVCVWATWSHFASLR